MSNLIKVESTSILEKQKWLNLIDGVSISVYMTWEYCDIFVEKYKYDIQLLKITNKESGLIICYSSRSKTEENIDIYSIYGYGGIYVWGEGQDVLFNKLREELGKKNIITFYLMAYPGTYDFSTNIEEYRTSYTLDLELSKEDLWKKLHSNHRYEISKFEKQYEYELITTGFDFFKDFKDLYNFTLERVSASSVYNYDDESIIKLLNNPYSFAIGLKFKDKIHNIIIFLLHNREAEYFINAASFEGRVASRFLLWEGLRYLKEKGVTRLNLGGGVKEGDYLDDFKRRFGGNKSKIGISKGVINQELYNRLCKQFEVNLSVNYFPEYWYNEKV